MQVFSVFESEEDGFATQRLKHWVCIIWMALAPTRHMTVTTHIDELRKLPLRKILLQGIDDVVFALGRGWGGLGAAKEAAHGGRVGVVVGDMVVRVVGSIILEEHRREQTRVPVVRQAALISQPRSERSSLWLAPMAPATARRNHRHTVTSSGAPLPRIAADRTRKMPRRDMH
jgi:hypothetical protein